MKRILLGSLLVTLLTAVMPVAAQPPETHVPVPGGWTAVDQEYRYGRDDLWEYINGAAELFLTYRFRELVVADFEQGEGSLTVSVYDMGSPLDAYGIFETEKPAKAQALADAGSAALLQPPYRGLLIKDRFYVKIEAGGGDIGTEALAGALRDVAAGLPGDDGLPAELEALPEEGRVAGTVAFAGSDYLGLEDLKACLHAEYQDAAGEQYGLFVMKPSADFLRNEAGKWAQSTQGDHQVFTREIPYRGAVVLMGDENQLIGVSGISEVARATALLESLMP
jgi:hypothetical protein